MRDAPPPIAPPLPRREAHAMPCRNALHLSSCFGHADASECDRVYHAQNQTLQVFVRNFRHDVLAESPVEVRRMVLPSFGRGRLRPLGWQRATEQLSEDDAGCPDISLQPAPLGDHPLTQQLRRDILVLARNALGVEALKHRSLEAACTAEVGELGAAIARLTISEDEDVRGGDVAVHAPGLRQLPKATEDIHTQAQQYRMGNVAGAHLQIPPLDDLAQIPIALLHEDHAAPPCRRHSVEGTPVTHDVVRLE
mmetsp:Transcript_99486/g.195421  ORF Transcript_99486/g.195421 Transcript_99486/m.195421 type:complete len:252 (-) Transcript_99486:386-1141(-)